MGIITDIMKNKIFTATLFVLVIFALATVAWSTLRDNKSTQSTTLNEVSQTETEIISMEKPASFDGVEMVTYKSPYGYEITYPKKWITILAPKETHPNLLEDYALYPKDIQYGPSPIFTIIVLKSSIKEYFKNQASIEKLTRISLNGSHGYRHKSASSGLYDPLHEVTFYVFPIKENLTRIEYWPNREYYPVTEEEALWILSTFRIVE